MMYDILCEMWKNPGSTFTPLPFWFWNDRIEKDELVRQIDDFHKKGVDGFVLHPRMGMEPEYLSDAYFELVETCLEAAERRRMMVVLYDEGMYPSGSAHGMVAAEDRRFAARALTAVPTGETDEDAEILYRAWFRLNEGKLEDVRLDRPKEDGYISYDFVLTYTGGTIRGLQPDEDDGQPNAPAAADLLNPAAVERFTKLTHDAYYARFSRFFGKTVIGFFTDEPSVAGRCADMKKKISWSYGMLEDFFACGGDFTDLAALLFPAADKKIARHAERVYKKSLHQRLDNVYYHTLSAWCTAHGVALMGHPAESGDCDTVRLFDVPGQDLVWRMVEEGNELTAPDSVMAKVASDAARHMGAARNSNECFGVCGAAGNPWNFTPDDMMWYLNFLFARGCNMILPHAFYYSVRTPLQSNERPPDVGPNNIWWKDYRKIAMYIKRLSWLNTTCANHPVAAVLCSAEHVPVRPVEPLYREGYPFNYLTVDDFMNRAHIHDGKIRIDRYSYDLLLVDSRLPIDASIVEKIGRFVVEGGKMYNGSNFIDFVVKNVRLTSYFEGETNGNLRFVPLTKSGCPFFLMVNEGRGEITGRLVTDQNGAAADFDPFTGETFPKAARLCGHGFAYDVTIPPHSVRILGINPGALVTLEKEEPAPLHLREIVSLGEEKRTFTCREDAERVLLNFTAIHDLVDVSVNDQPAGRLLFMPYTLDITPFVHPGTNTVDLTVTGSMANTYGTPVPVGCEGCTVRIYGGNFC
ncbi:MAG: hypothetical protein ACI4V1_05360 [Eubacteriales bacterium]